VKLGTETDKKEAHSYKLFESVLLTEKETEGEAEFYGKSFHCDVLIFRIKGIPY
jgi:hypothetical protein